MTDDGVWVYTAKSKTRRDGEGKWRFIRDRADLQIVWRVRAWLGDLRKLDADNPILPLFRDLSTTGNLKRRSNATVRGLHLPGGAINEIVKKRAAAAGVTYINDRQVTSHSLRAGPNTDMKRAKVPLVDRREAPTGARNLRCPTPAATGRTTPSSPPRPIHLTPFRSSVDSRRTPPSHKMQVKAGCMRRRMR